MLSFFRKKRPKTNKKTAKRRKKTKFLLFFYKKRVKTRKKKLKVFKDADEGGFEPPILIQYAGFQDRYLKPLRHSSIRIKKK